VADGDRGVPISTLVTHSSNHPMPSVTETITGIPTATKTDAAVSTVEFALDRRLNARDPCGNLVEGTYRVTNDAIGFSLLATSLIGCPPELTIYVALYNTRGARIEGLKLVLVDAKGVVVLEATFTSATPAPSPKPAVTSTPPWTPVPLTPPASPTPPG